VKNRVSQLALRIAEIEEEFSKGEIREAIKILEQRGSTSSVKTLLLRDVVRRAPNPRRKRKTKLIEDQRSKAVLDLEHRDPEKYAVLSEFDALLRKGSVLPEVVELKMLGKSLSKTFSSKSSRREAISKLMTVLAEKPLLEIREVVRNILSSHQGDDGDSDYYKLAQFIITGKTSQAQDARRA
jgi:hypothetical protein